MQAILQFMYLGEANIFQGRINKFMLIAKEFELKEVSEECLDEEEESDGFDIVEHLIGRERNDEEGVQEEDIEKNTSLDKIIYDTNSMGEQHYLDVDACEYDAVKNVKAKLKPLVKQEGDFFYCDQCDYQTRRKGDVKKHWQYKHEGVSYACGQCEYRPKDRSSLRKHQRAIHEGIRYPCDQCDYKTGRQQSLRKHKENKHSSNSNDLDVTSWNVVFGDSKDDAILTQE